MRAGSAEGPADAIASKSRWERGPKTRSSQLPPDATPAVNRPDAAHKPIDAPKSRFMVLPIRLPPGRASPVGRHHSHKPGQRGKRENTGFEAPGSNRASHNLN